MKIKISSPSEAVTEGIAKQFACGVQAHSTGGLVIFLEGDLGAGKTTFSRGLLHALGHEGSVKSPTYTLVEPYEINGQPLFHFDLYRLTDPEELEFMGIRDYFNERSTCLVEWPEKGHGLLPEQDIQVFIEYDGDGRSYTFEAMTEIGQKILNSLEGMQ